jgi:hypothetical protein
MESAGAVVLKRSLWNSSPRRRNHKEMIRASSVTVTVPAAVPNNRTEVNTNVSETDIVASIEGNFTVIEPVSSVSAARMNHCDVTGAEYNV